MARKSGLRVGASRVASPTFETQTQTSSGAFAELASPPRRAATAAGANMWDAVEAPEVTVPVIAITTAPHRPEADASSGRRPGKPDARRPAAALLSRPQIDAFITLHVKAPAERKAIRRCLARATAAAEGDDEAPFLPMAKHLDNVVAALGDACTAELRDSLAAQLGVA
jgi:hypothetical protein